MPQKPTKPQEKPESEAERRERRLAEALRANLKRRKAPASGKGQGKEKDTAR